MSWKMSAEPQTGDRQIFVLVSLLEHLSVWISVELLRWVGASPSFKSSHAWRGALGSEQRFLRESDLARGSRNLQKGEQEPSLFPRAHLAGAAWLSAPIRSLFSGEGECLPRCLTPC